ncbi:MAG: hypothetical protein QM767_09420 [Anaeromyxobacter sp.]
MSLALLAVALLCSTAPPGAPPQPASTAAAPAAPTAALAVPASAADPALEEALDAGGAASEGLGGALGPDLSPRLGRPRLDGGGLLRGRDLMGASLGTMAGDAAVAGLTFGTYLLFTRGVISPTVGNFRAAGLTLAAGALLLPPLGATLGGSLFHRGPRDGAAWKAFLLSLLGHSAALMVAYMAAPQYWALVPVQLGLMAPGTSLGLNWGPGHRGLASERPPGPSADAAPARPAPGPAPFALGPTCPIAGSIPG